jgi:rubrerythrin
LPESVETALLEALTGPEGEYAAYASYAAVLEEYGDIEPYATIADAELRHIEALQRLLDKYGVEYPSENPYLVTIQAPANLATAAQAWADGEIANVELYDELLAEVEGYSDITRVFLNLQFASQEAHLPAFELAAENGGTITPGQMVDQIATYQERNGIEGYAYGEKGMIRWRGGN